MSADARDSRAAPTAVARTEGVTRPVADGNADTRKLTDRPARTSAKLRQYTPWYLNVPGAWIWTKLWGGVVHSRTALAGEPRRRVANTR